MSLETRLEPPLSSSLIENESQERTIDTNVATSGLFSSYGTVRATGQYRAVRPPCPPPWVLAIVVFLENDGNDYASHQQCEEHKQGCNEVPRSAWCPSPPDRIFVLVVLGMFVAVFWTLSMAIACTSRAEDPLPEAALRGFVSLTASSADIAASLRRRKERRPLATGLDGCRARRLRTALGHHGRRDF